MKNKLSIFSVVLLLAVASGCSAQTESDSEFRHWTTKSGRKSDAELKVVEQTADSVKLQRKDNGKVVTLKIDTLSDKDRAYLAARQTDANATSKASSATGGGENEWAQFRGPDGLGISTDTGLPLTWSDSSNIAWKTKMPGHGSSSPITWGDHVYLTCYSGFGFEKQNPGNKDELVRHLICVNRDDGEIIWDKQVAARGKSNTGFTDFDSLHGFATSTPVADDTGVYVSFSTSGLACYSHDGEQKWISDIGDGTHGWGTSASPLLYEDLVIINADIESKSMIALNKSGGEEAWRVPTHMPDTWSTPLLLNANGRDELVFHHSRGDPDATIKAVDPENGSALWECKALCNYLCPAPIAHDGIIYAIAYQRSAAIRAGGSGEVSDSHILWQSKIGSEICTPVYHDGHLYFSHQESGVVYCLDAKTGEKVYENRLEPHSRALYASAVLADGKIYYVSRENGTFVVAAKPQFEQLAHNKIDSDDSVFNATPAVSRGQLLIRSNQHLYCIGN